MHPPQPPKHKDDLRKKALSSILANSPQAGSSLVQQQKEAEEEVVQDEEEEEEEGDTFPVECDLNFPQRQSKLLVPKLATWEQYWDHRLDLWLPERNGRFSVYMAGSSGPVVLCCHGGGYTGLSWSLVARQLKDKYRVVAPDLRGHGLTTTDNDKDMSKETFAADIVAIWRHLFGESSSSSSGNNSGTQGGVQQQDEPQQQQHQQQAQTAPPHTASSQEHPPPFPNPNQTTALVHGPGTSAPAGTFSQPQQAIPSPPQSSPAAVAEAAASSAPPSPPPPPTLLVGHSMGGAAATWAASTREIKNLAGLIVVDVVEGTALAALPSMIGILCRRPKHFASREAAVTWALKSGMCKSREAAAISVPAQIRFQPQQQQQQQQQQGGGQRDEQQQELEVQGQGEDQGQQQQNPQQDGQQQETQQQQQQQGPGTWVWRTDLAATQPFWHGWYSGLSDAFLKVPGPKMLMLAGTDRLDKPLTIGQMQGKFQLVLLPMAGHAVHEDEAAAAANHIRTFLQRFRVGEPPLVVPRPSTGLKPVLPIVAGPIHKP